MTAASCGRMATRHFRQKESSSDGKLHVSDAFASGLEAAERDAADLLYRYGFGSILVTILASSGLAFISVGQVASKLLGQWWLLITIVLVARGIDIWHFRKVRALWRWPGRLNIQCFGLGVVVTAALWGAFPIAFFY